MSGQRTDTEIPCPNVYVLVPDDHRTPTYYLADIAFRARHSCYYAVMGSGRPFVTVSGRATMAPASYSDQDPLLTLARQQGFDNLLDAALSWARQLDQGNKQSAAVAAEMNRFAEHRGLEELHRLFLKANGSGNRKLLGDDFEAEMSSKYEITLCKEWDSICEMEELKQKTNFDMTTDGLERFNIQELYRKMRSSAPTLVHLIERLCCNPRNYQPQQSPDLDIIIRVVLSIAQVAHARNSNNNYIETIIGMYMYGSKVPKRVINMMAKIGFVTCHQTIINKVKDASSRARQNLKALVTSGKAFQVSFDNVNLLRNVRDQRVLNQKSMANLTAGFIVFLPESLAPTMLSKKADLLLLEVSRLRPEDFFPTDDDDTTLFECFRALIWDIIYQFCEKRKFGDKLAKGRFMLPEKYQLEHKEKHLVHTLPIYEKNEGAVREMIDILQSIADDLGMTSEQLKNALILFKGDFLTVRNIRFVKSDARLILIRLAQRQTSENFPEKDLSFIEAAAGLFHLEIAVVEILFATHVGQTDDKCVLSTWIPVLEKDTSKLWDKSGSGSVKDFR
ncbi:MAG TPA: hypothetical protein VFQ43_00375, partial [Nitrososphaera sp.]|nr:hypothetical protein [Nitrososphaera sp.]